MPRRLTRKGGSCCGRSGRRPSMRRSGPAVGGKKRKTARRPRRKATKKYGKKRRTRRHKRRHYRGGEGGDKLSDTQIEDELVRAHIPQEYWEDARPQLQALRLPVPDDYVSQFYTSYATRVAVANKAYEATMARVPQQLETARQEAEEENEEFTEEHEIEWKEMLEGFAKRRRTIELRIAESYKNDLANYAYALLVDWSKYGGMEKGDPLV